MLLVVANIAQVMAHMALGMHGMEVNSGSARTYSFGNGI